MDNKKILIIGGAGFIGHNLALKLKLKKYDVNIIDGLIVNNINTVIGNLDNLPNPELSHSMLNERFDLLKENNIPLHVQDARDYNGLSNIINQINPNIIVHLAAVSHANRSNKDPFSTFDHSLRTLENALDNTRNKVDHFIYFSSSMVYGNFKSDKVDENTVCEPLGIYGALKYSGELMVKAYNQTFDLPYTIIRPSALYGERCISRRVGQIFIENAISDKDITIDGDGSDLLDFTYIQDLVGGIIKIIENKNAINNTFNITYGSARKISDLINILKISFPNIKINYKKRDKLMPHRGTLSIEKAIDLIGYKPDWPIEKGYSQYIDWYKKFKNYS